jgi:tRNA threonylcarbamoyladenosine biosynthesis protein TsaB
MTYVLSIDTSSPFCSLSLFFDENLQREVSFQPQNNLSATLIPEIDHLLKDTGCSLDGIGLIGVSVGPGLFTGIRVGLATVKGLFFHRQCPVVPVSTLEAWVLKCSDFSGDIVPVIDAKKNDVFWGIYRLEGGIVHEKHPPVLTPVQNLDGELKSLKKPCFAGTGVTAHREILEEMFPLGVFVNTDSNLAAAVGKKAYRDFKSGRYITDLEKLTPCYLREAILR